MNLMKHHLKACEERLLKEAYLEKLDTSIKK